MNSTVKYPCWLCLWVGLVAFSPDGRSATIDLHEFLPYKRTDNIGNSSLRSTTGTGFEFRFYSTTSDFGFDWDFRKGTAQRRETFRRQTLRKDANGLAVTVNTFYDNPDYVLPTHASVLNPHWVIASQMVNEGDVIISSGTYAGTDIVTPWTGTTKGTVTIGHLENRHTPAGQTDVLPFTFEYLWSDSGPGSWGTGVVSQTWWLTREMGAFQVRYSYAETNTLGEVFTESDAFHIQTSTSSTNTTVVTFPDPNLEAAVRARLFKPTGNITAWDMAFLLDLNAPDAGITNLTGLEHAYRLATLRLPGNNLADISVLADLPELVILDLARNSVSDIGPLQNLTLLHQLTLNSNAVSNVDALLNLTNLTHLYLTRNQITELDSLANQAKLRELYADENLISDVSGLEGLPSLEIAILGSNRIVDVSPLANLPGLVHLEIEMNQVHDLTPLASLNLIQASVEENCLDVTPGADDRLVIEGWIMGGTTVEKEWPLQYDCEPTIIRIGLTVTGDVPMLQWLTETGATYQVESSTNLVNWTDVPSGSFIGTGDVVQWTGQVTTLTGEYFRVRLESVP